ncbi:hypothetical protein, partial [Laribacter hongkongensis]|uniref:hypothetical protein n=1 Tax=Laribacter hongkongensis TaxID=168471 RepID=UPI001EFC986E
NPAKCGLRRQKQRVQRRSLRQIAEHLLSEEAEPTVGSSGSRFLEVPTKVRLAGEMVPVTALLKTTDVMLLLLSRWTSVTTVPYGIPAP